MVESHVILSVLLISTCWNFVHMHKKKLVIDNDAGGDDAAAIFTALLNEKYFDGPELVALTTGHGNTEEKSVNINNQRILKLANRQDVPIYRGSREALLFTPETTAYFGLDGLGDANDESLDVGLVPAQKKNAVFKLIELSKKYRKNLHVVTIGTLTNVALAIKLDPLFLERIGHLYVGAGHIHSDLHSEPEFNALMDVEAYHIVAKNANPNKVTVLPYSQVKEHLNISKRWRKDVLGSLDTDIIRAQNKFEAVSLPKDGDSWDALDPAVVALAVKPNLVQEYKYSKNDIILCGDKRGMNTNTFVGKEDGNVRVIYSVKKEEFKNFLLAVFSAELEKTDSEDKLL